MISPRPGRVRDCPRAVDGLILSSPALAVSLSGPQRSLLSVLPPAAQPRYRQRAGRQRHLARPATITAYLQDPLVHDRGASARLAACLARRWPCSVSRSTRLAHAEPVAWWPVPTAWSTQGAGGLPRAHGRRGDDPCVATLFLRLFSGTPPDRATVLQACRPGCGTRLGDNARKHLFIAIQVGFNLTRTQRLMDSVNGSVCVNRMMAESINFCDLAAGSPGGSQPAAGGGDCAVRSVRCCHSLRAGGVLSAFLSSPIPARLRPGIMARPRSPAALAQTLTEVQACALARLYAEAIAQACQARECQVGA